MTGGDAPVDPAPPRPAPQPSGDPASSGRARFDRRAFFAGGAAGLGLGAGAALGIGAVLGTAAPQDPEPSGSSADTERSLGDGGELPGFGGEALACHGAHQAGIMTAPAAHIRYLAYDLRADVDTDALRRMFRVLTEDIEGLSSGEGPLADPEPELAARPARLTITVGVGRGLVERVDPGSRPSWLRPLPAFSHDRLGDDYGETDLLLVLQSDDPLALAHGARMLERDLGGFGVRRWQQSGFRRARGAEADGTTMRNLMGQVDGTVNPDPAAEDFAPLVWLDDSAGWLSGGSALVLRRIRMELDTWDRVDRPGREQTIGRRLADGSPLSAPPGSGERTPADFDATDGLGLSAISTAAHIRRAHSEDPDERIFRRAANYDDAGEAGLLFACYQRDPLRQFVPIQRRLDAADLLNEWVTHTGSAVFAILPGFRPGEILGATLLS